MHRRTSKKWPRVVAAGVTATAFLALFGSTGHATPAAGPVSSTPVSSMPVRATTALNPTAYRWKNAHGTRILDGHGYFKRSCVSFAAWAIRTDGRPHTKSPDFLGDAGRWRGAATSSVPHVGDIAQWDPGVHGTGRRGHVAYVAAVRNDGRVTLYEYSYRSEFNDQRADVLSVRAAAASDASRYLRF
ncbi:CHAP domain-containing protein [Streptomyces avermitilis]|uniref:CHAP domain-containing protein n=1 Tax=Streptomyces avermitilis TaxID=33903 RepID=UPI0038127160